jgi:FkbM family methyltransferase
MERTSESAIAVYSHTKKLRIKLKSSQRPFDLRQAVKQFAIRAGRSAVYRLFYWPLGGLRAAKSRFKGIVMFPLRNTLLGHKPISVVAGGEAFLLSPKGAVALDAFSRPCFDSKHELDFILKVLRPGMTFFDIGANVGVFTIPAAKKLCPGSVFAFEPAAWTYERLLENVSLNRVTNVHAVRTAVGEVDGKASLKINVGGKDALNTLGRPTHSDSEIIAEETVAVTSLDNFMRANSVLRVDVMKVDVEGAELFVFRGAEKLLSSENAPLILYESGFLSRGFDYHPVEQMWLLRKHGYLCFIIDQGRGRVLVPTHEQAYNAMVIAVRPDHATYSLIKDLACSG